MLSKMKMVIAALALVFVSMVVSNSAHAAGNGLTNGWLGADGGLTVPTYHDTSARGAWGFSAGAKIGSEWGLGAYFLHSSAHEDIDPATNVPFNYNLFGLQWTYHFEGDALGAYFGVRVGISKVKQGGANISPVNYGAIGGYDYFFNRHFSLGGEVDVMGVGSGDDKGVHFDGFAMINVLGAAKFWF